VSSLLLFLATHTVVDAATLEEALVALKEQPVTATEQDLLSQVSWQQNPEPAYFQCRDRKGNISLELWYGSDGRAKGQRQEPQPLMSGTLGPLLVLSYYNEKGRPAKGAYLLTPSGLTHLFRVNNSEHIAGSSITFQCETAQAPT